MIPEYWQTDLSAVSAWAERARKASVRHLTDSAGGRPVWLFAYGEKEELHPSANYSSACGAHDVTCYLDRKHLRERLASYIYFASMHSRPAEISS